jgi:ubiquinone/menaquinone biosynthesis C-methylase UbiE
MAGLFDKQAKEYLENRPTYPASWFSQLASLTANHQLAWDVGAGNGQASVSIAEHYDRVIATDISKQQLELARKHPKVTYVLSPPVMTDEELTSIVGEEGSVDLVTVATAVHWFDLETFYPQVKRVLRKPGGVIAVWTYVNPSVSPAVDAVSEDFFESTRPYWNPKIKSLLNGYRTLSFPFEAVLENGKGGEGNPVETDMEKEVSLDEYLGWFRSLSAVTIAREKGVELLNEGVLRRFREAWGDENKTYTCKYPLHLLAGRCLY